MQVKHILHGAFPLKPETSRSFGPERDGKDILPIKNDEAGISFPRQLTNRYFDGNSGSLVTLTPSLRRPAASPGVGMWVR